MSSKFAKLTTLFATLVRKPSLLLRAITDNEPWRKYVLKTYGLESLPLVPFTRLFPETRNDGIEVMPYTFLDGGSMVTDLAALRLFARRKSGGTYFEIGTWRGESAVNVAREGAEVHTLNLSAEEMLSMNYGEANTAQIGLLFEEGLDVTLHRGNSATFDLAGLKKKFDLIFIDGDHHYDSVKRDTERVFQNLVKKDTILCWHDYAYHPEGIRHEVMAGIMDGLPAEFHERLHHISNTKMAVLLPEKMEGIDFTSPQTPEYAFSVYIKAYPRTTGK